MRGTVCSQYSCIRTGAITETVSVCQATAMLWAAHLCESLSLGAVDRPLGPAGTQGPICSTECVILSQQACHSSNHSNTHSFLEFFLNPRASEDNQGPFICLDLERACLFDSWTPEFVLLGEVSIIGCLLL